MTYVEEIQDTDVGDVRGNLYCPVYEFSGRSGVNPFDTLIGGDGLGIIIGLLVIVILVIIIMKLMNRQIIVK